MTNDAPLPFVGACALTHWGVIRAQGADASSFLQGQLTNDVAQLPLGDARLAGYCSAKGRLLASFIVWREGPDDVFLACHQSLLAATVKRLSMFVLRAKCRLSDASTQRPLWGLVGDTAAPWVRDLSPWKTQLLNTAVVLRLPDVAGHVRALWMGNTMADVPASATALALDSWRALEVASGLPTIEAATADQFVPQMLNYELMGGVSFQKGCYPGQEVVARSQYRGITKRRMFLFHASAAAAPGTEVFHSEDLSQPAGLVVNSAPTLNGTGCDMLVEVKLAALHQGDLHLATINGPVLVQKALPYAVTLDADTII